MEDKKEVRFKKGDWVVITSMNGNNIYDQYSKQWCIGKIFKVRRAAFGYVFPEDNTEGWAIFEDSVVLAKSHIINNILKEI
jgi:hypothetical protein